MSDKKTYRVYVGESVLYYETDDYEEARMLAMVLSERTGEEAYIIDIGGYWVAPFVLQKYKYGSYDDGGIYNIDEEIE